ncbi:MAG: hypothetical protein U0625_11355 [Phycisphaerales bacterium]
MTAAAPPAIAPVSAPPASRGAFAAPQPTTTVRAPAAPVAATPAPAPASAPAAPRTPAPAAAALRDDPVQRHELVRTVARLFDATVVRVEAAGTLPAQHSGRSAEEATEGGDTDV